MALSNALPNSILQPGVCTSTTRPSNPYEGQFIYETNTDALLVYNGTAWVVPSGPTGNPTLNNQFANKSYVDTSVSNLQTSVDGSIDTLETAISNRPTINGASNMIIKATDAVPAGGVDNVGQMRVNFISAFPSECVTVVACSGDATVTAQFMSIVQKDRFGFTIRAFTAVVGSSPLSVQRPPQNDLVRVSYIAVGY